MVILAILTFHGKIRIIPVSPILIFHASLVLQLVEEYSVYPNRGRSELHGTYCEVCACCSAAGLCGRAERRVRPAVRGDGGGTGGHVRVQSGVYSGRVGGLHRYCTLTPSHLTPSPTIPTPPSTPPHPHPTQPGVQRGRGGGLHRYCTPSHLTPSSTIPTPPSTAPHPHPTTPLTLHTLTLLTKIWGTEWTGNITAKKYCHLPLCEHSCIHSDTPIFVLSETVKTVCAIDWDEVTHASRLNDCFLNLDIDECLVDNGGCSDVCENIAGSYQCACPTGYALRDATTCTGRPVPAQRQEIKICVFCRRHSF